MRYFKKFPQISYTQTEYSNGSLPQEITRLIPNMTVKLQLDIINKTDIAFQTYTIQDKDRPDTVSAQMYGTSEYTWVILLANNMRDWFDWPLTEQEFSEYIKEKYESSPGAADGLDRSIETVVEYKWNSVLGSTIYPITLSSSLGGIDLNANGTVSVLAGNTTVTGVNTAFSSVITASMLPSDCLFVVGNTATTAAQYRAVISVINATALIVSEPFTTSLTGTSYRLITDLPDGFSLAAVEKITAYEKEVAENDTKRNIRLPDKESLPVIVEQLNQLLRV